MFNPFRHKWKQLLKRIHFRKHFQNYAFTSPFYVNRRRKCTSKCVYLWICLRVNGTWEKHFSCANGFTNHARSSDCEIPIRAGFPLLTIVMYDHLKLLFSTLIVHLASLFTREGSCPTIVDLIFTFHGKIWTRPFLGVSGCPVRLLIPCHVLSSSLSLPPFSLQL